MSGAVERTRGEGEFRHCSVLGVRHRRRRPNRSQLRIRQVVGIGCPEAEGRALILRLRCFHRAAFDGNRLESVSRSGGREAIDIVASADPACQRSWLPYSGGNGSSSGKVLQTRYMRRIGLTRSRHEGRPAGMASDRRPSDASLRFNSPASRLPGRSRGNCPPPARQTTGSTWTGGRRSSFRS